MPQLTININHDKSFSNKAFFVYLCECVEGVVLTSKVNTTMSKSKFWITMCMQEERAPELRCPRISLKNQEKKGKEGIYGQEKLK